MAIIGEELQGFVINQINARQLLHGSGAGNDIANTRTDQQLNLLISNTSWIKLASGVSVSGSKLTEVGIPSSYEGMGLAKTYVLNAGFSKLEDGRLQQREGFLPQQPDSSYTYGTYGYSPMPGIISADIKTLNRGSLKKATVRIKINNKEQFDIIDLLYLRLGFTVLLEWGNSIYTPDGITRETVRGTLVEDPYRFFNSAFGGKHSYLDILPVINFYKSKYAGNYDALLGKVSNFSWSFNADGSYDAEITIISLGDVIESLKLNVSTDKNLNNFIIVSTGGTPINEVQQNAQDVNNNNSTLGKVILGNDADFWSLLTICLFEDGDNQGRADVAQSIYNRAGSGVYSTSIAAVIKANGQYEPAFAPGTQVTATVWKNISNKTTAIAAVKSLTNKGYNTDQKALNALKTVYDTLKNTTYQNQAKLFIQGRTDFLSITQGNIETRNKKTSSGNYSKDGSRVSFVMRTDGGGNNVYGFAYNYKKNTVAQPPGPDFWDKYKDQF
jgi:hypothetical protein